MGLWFFIAGLFTNTQQPVIAVVIMLLIEAAMFVWFAVIAIKQKFHVFVRVILLIVSFAICLFGSMLIMLAVGGTLLDKYPEDSLQVAMGSFGSIFLSGVTALTSAITVNYVLFHWRLESRFIQDKKRRYLSKNKSWALGILGSLQITVSFGMLALYSLLLIGSAHDKWWQNVIVAIISIAIFVLTTPTINSFRIVFRWKEPPVRQKKQSIT